MKPSNERKLVGDVRMLMAESRNKGEPTNFRDNIDMLAKRAEASERKINHLENIVEGLMEAGKRKTKKAKK